MLIVTKATMVGLLNKNDIQTEARTANSTLAKGGISPPLDSFLVAESSVLRKKFRAEKPAHRQYAKRQQQIYGNTTIYNR
jgi:hypothetical protein